MQRRHGAVAKRLPENFNDIIKIRLQKYLSLAATVDFNAQLLQKNDKVYFVDRNYEAKNYEWKMIFRAGKEVYDVAKPFAEQWMSELKVTINIKPKDAMSTKDKVIATQR